MSSGTADWAMGTVVKDTPMTDRVPAPHWKGMRGCLTPRDWISVMTPATMMDALMR